MKNKADFISILLSVIAIQFLKPMVIKDLLGLDDISFFYDLLIFIPLWIVTYIPIRALMELFVSRGSTEK